MNHVKEWLKAIVMFPLYFYKKVTFLLSLKNITQITMSQLSFAPQNLLVESLPLSSLKINDIVYVKSSPKKETYELYPAIGSAYEIDCKVVELLPDFKYGPSVRLISGHGAYFTAPIESIVLPKDRAYYSGKKLIQAKVDTELFPKETLFELKGDYFSSEQCGVYLHQARLKDYSHIFIEV